MDEKLYSPLLQNLKINKNYRDIALTDITVKFYNDPLTNHIWPEVEKILWKNQNSLWRNQSTTSQTFSLNHQRNMGKNSWGNCPVGWGCRIHWLHLCRGIRPPPTWVSWYDTKQSDGEVPAVLELWGMRSTPLLPLLPGPLWPGAVAPDGALSMG